jgi:alcohol dehydrogenase class IV
VQSVLPTLALDLTLPSRVIVRAGAIAELGGHLAGRGRVLMVTGRSGRDRAVVALGSAVPLAGSIEVSGEPTLARLRDAIGCARELDPAIVVGIGGGSVLDTAKVLAAFVPNRSDLAQHLEVVGDGRPLECDPLPIVAVPTTFGTGSEMTYNAVVGLPDAGRKVSLRDRRLIPTLVLIDPELARGVPPTIERAAAFDAAVQLIEAAATPFGNAATRAIAMRGARYALPALRELIETGTSDAVRTALGIGAACSGVALANAKLGTVHGFAGVLGGLVPVAHGQLCALFAAPVLRATIAALQARGTDVDARTLAVYAELSDLLVPTVPGAAPAVNAVPDAGALPDRIAELVSAALLPSDVLVAGQALDPADVIAAVRTASSTAGNPVMLSDSVLRDILAEVLS